MLEWEPGLLSLRVLLAPCGAGGRGVGDATPLLRTSCTYPAPRTPYPCPVPYTCASTPCCTPMPPIIHAIPMAIPIPQTLFSMPHAPCPLFCPMAVPHVHISVPVSLCPMLCPMCPVPEAHRGCTHAGEAGAPAALSRQPGHVGSLPHGPLRLRLPLPLLQPPGLPPARLQRPDPRGEPGHCGAWQEHHGRARHRG